MTLAGEPCRFRVWYGARADRGMLDGKVCPTCGAAQADHPEDYWPDEPSSIAFSIQSPVELMRRFRDA